MAIAYEIDFLPVGEGEHSGDAIAMRYGEPGAYIVHVVDGGTLDAGDKLVDHIERYYGSTYVDFVVLTHADDDHSSGLRRVLQRCTVGALIMNRPWLYAEELVPYLKDQRWTAGGLAKRLRDDFPILAELDELATDSRVPVYTAFSGTRIGDYFTIVAPSKARYLELIAQFSRTPEAASSERQKPGNIFVRALERAAQWISETWFHETLAENPETSASNESSVVQFGVLGDHKILLTADAGVQALTEAADNSEALGFALPGLNLMQIPHHGSRHNVSPTVLNRFIGPPVGIGESCACYAYASVAAETRTHPRKVVTNAFIRRGATVSVTAGQSVYHFRNFELRPGWSAIASLPFYHSVEG